MHYISCIALNLSRVFLIPRHSVQQLRKNEKGQAFFSFDLYFQVKPTEAADFNLSGLQGQGAFLLIVTSVEASR